MDGWVKYRQHIFTGPAQGTEHQGFPKAEEGYWEGPGKSKAFGSLAELERQNFR